MLKIKTLLKSLFASLPLSIFLMALYAACIGWATFVERDYGTLVANDVIYHSWWFETLNAWLLINILGCLRQSIKLGVKISMAIFHFSFVVIIIGAGITRFYGFEGNLVLKNGETSSFIRSADSFLNVLVSNEIGENSSPRDIDPLASFKEGFEINLSPYVRYSSFTLKKEVFDKFLQIKSIDIINYSLQSLYADASKGEPSEQDIAEAKKQNHYIAAFEVEYDGVKKTIQVSNRGEISIEKFGNRYITLSWGPKSMLLPFSITLQKFEVINYPGSQMPSSYASYVEVNDNESGDVFEYKIFMNNVLDFKGYRFFQSSYTTNDSEDGVIYTGTVLSVNNDPGRILTYIGYTLLIIGAIWLLFDKDSRFRQLGDFVQRQKILSLFVGIVIISFIEPSIASQANAHHSRLNTLDISNKIDANAKSKNQVQAFMRYFDELANKQQELEPLLEDSSLEAIKARLESLRNIPKDYLQSFSQLQIQGMDGHIKIMDTYSHEVMRKIVESSTFRGLKHNQFLLGLLALPYDMAKLRFIRVKNKQILKMLGVNQDAFVSFNDLFVADSLNDIYEYAMFPTQESLDKFKQGYKLYHFVITAIKKPESERNEFDKQILKLHDKMDYLMPFSIWNYMRIFPNPNNINLDLNRTSQVGNLNMETKQGEDKSNNDIIGTSVVPHEEISPDLFHELHTWHSLGNPFLLKDPLLIYFYNSLVIALQQGILQNDWSRLPQALNAIHDYQERTAGVLYLDSMHVKSELLLNSIDIFPISQYFYLILGMILFFIALIAIIINKKIPQWLGRSIYIILMLVFISHTIGLLLRWYVGGHAPWSNAYESMLYIAWASALSGIVILRKSYFALCGSSFLAGMALTVAHWGFMDPQIGNLQPVLQSYWLNIHVAIIVASYGFLGLSLMLGAVNMILFIFRNPNRPQIDSSILSISAINEMSMIIGVLMLSVGTFLGGVWANESWGRYWSWDSKETWSLVSIGVYACVLHIRLLKIVHIVYIFNALSVLAFYSIIMTYFGVNYYLATGLHSYARGDAANEISIRIIICVGITLLIVLLAFLKRKLPQTKDLYG
ncbi:cytochrome c-type biogenesis protein CcsB [Helicobacter muridarum]|uniref:Bifunctional cytochrome c biogenesis protein n=1 Tax=Helicobacter muridarum TaxID=216 RepID=A0A099TUJ0_9HELI|nr:cytochrome c biogenesis protein CcsA [Helicobacter muridarum]TLE01581.1 cytochrome c-type biogenesis protein CcsB [Helicobacter muridarum]STQ86191.1 bifunctional cytochrome c biogenesis protein [Helicobacter muridarum]